MADAHQIIPPPPGLRLLSHAERVDNRGGVRLRELWKSHKVKTPSALDFRVSLAEAASFPDTRGWDVSMPLESLPRIWWPRRRVGRFVLAVDGPMGEGLLLEVLGDEEGLVRVHPHPLHLDVDTLLRFGETSAAFATQTLGNGSGIGLRADPESSNAVLLEGSDDPTLPYLDAAVRARAAVELDTEIQAWGETLARAFEVNRSGSGAWPAALCRHVLPDARRREELEELLRGIAVLACDRFDYASGQSLVLSPIAPLRPDPTATTAAADPQVFINLRNVLMPSEMTAWIETAFRDACLRRWPGGWYEVIGPTTSSRLGVQGRGGRAGVEVQGPFSNHQKMAAMSALT